MHIGIAGSAVNPPGEIFHLPDRVAGKLTVRTPDSRDVLAPRSGYEALDDHHFFIGTEVGYSELLFCNQGRHAQGR
jgi:hypothetical protein